MTSIGCRCSPTIGLTWRVMCFGSGLGVLTLNSRIEAVKESVIFGVRPHEQFPYL